MLKSNRHTIISITQQTHLFLCVRVARSWNKEKSLAKKFLAHSKTAEILFLLAPQPANQTDE
jgi:hypothetical protein